MSERYSEAPRWVESARRLGRSMLAGFAAANAGEATYRAQAVLQPESVLNGEFPLVGRLLAEAGMSDSIASLE